MKQLLLLHRVQMSSELLQSLESRISPRLRLILRFRIKRTLSISISSQLRKRLIAIEGVVVV